jgi:hypothetical protein
MSTMRCLTHEHAPSVPCTCAVQCPCACLAGRGSASPRPEGRCPGCRSPRPPRPARSLRRAQPLTVPRIWACRVPHTEAGRRPRSSCRRRPSTRPPSRRGSTSAATRPASRRTGRPSPTHAHACTRTHVSMAIHAQGAGVPPALSSPALGYGVAMVADRQSAGRGCSSSLTPHFPPPPFLPPPRAGLHARARGNTAAGL